MITLHREESARNMTCPVRSHVLDNVPCVASRCMAWRWHGESPKPIETLAMPKDATDEQEATNRPGEGWIFQPAINSDNMGEDRAAYWEEPESATSRRRMGFCGLAGPCES